MPRHNYLRSEDSEQERVVAWARMYEISHPVMKLLHHVPNEGKRTEAYGAKMVRMGVKAGVPDLVLPVPRGKYHGLYVEMKYNLGVLRASQVEWLEALSQQGYYTAVCYGALEAIQVIRDYEALHSGEEMIAPSNSIYKDGEVWKVGENRRRTKGRRTR